jgi:hypothetical protein
MFFWGLAVNEDVVHVDSHKCADVVAEHIIHQALESSWGIGQAKG